MLNNSQQMQFLSDSQIIELYWQRKEKAIYETDKKYGKFLFGIAYNILHDNMDCEECQNDTYVVIWNTIPPERPSAFRAFIAQIIRRKAINRYKEKCCKKRIPSELTVSLDEIGDLFSSDSSVYSEYQIRETGRIINEFVMRLSKRQRYIFIERFYYCEPVSFIAKDLCVSPASIYREIETIKKELQKHLERNGVIV